LTRASGHAREDAAQVLDSLRRLIRFLRIATRRAEQRTGASAAQLFVLSQLAESEAASLAELSARTLTDASSVSTVVARLVRAGLVVRRRAAGERRRVELSLTARGRAQVARSPELAQTRILDALVSLPSARRRAVAAGLRTLITAIGADRMPPRMLFEDERARAEAPVRRSRAARPRSLP
jgi:DNA-binding MarR family transcriptional regulator